MLNLEIDAQDGYARTRKPKAAFQQTHVTEDFDTARTPIANAASLLSANVERCPSNVVCSQKHFKFHTNSSCRSSRSGARAR